MKRALFLLALGAGLVVSVPANAEPTPNPHAFEACERTADVPGDPPFCPPPAPPPPDGIPGA